MARKFKCIEHENEYQCRTCGSMDVDVYVHETDNYTNIMCQCRGCGISDNWDEE